MYGMWVRLVQGNIAALNVRVGFNAWGHPLSFRIWPLMLVDNAMNWNCVCLVWWNSDQANLCICMYVCLSICFERKISIAHTHRRERKCAHFEIKLWKKLLKIIKRMQNIFASNARQTLHGFIYIFVSAYALWINFLYIMSATPCYGALRPTFCFLLFSILNWFHSVFVLINW